MRPLRLRARGVDPAAARRRHPLDHRAHPRRRALRRPAARRRRARRHRLEPRPLRADGVPARGRADARSPSVVNAANGWPAIMASLSTAQPLPLQLGAVAGVGLVGLALVSALVGLALGAVPRRLADMVRLPERDADPAGHLGGRRGGRGLRRRASGCARRPWARDPGPRAAQHRRCRSSRSPSIRSPAS